MATNQDPQGSSHSKQRLSQTPFSGAEAVRKIMENFAGIQSAMTRFGETLYSISASANKVDFEFGNLARMIKMGRSSYSGGSVGHNGGGQYSSWNPNSGKDSSAFKPESMDVYEERLIEKKKIYDKVNLRKKETNEDPGGLQKYKANLMAKEEMYKVFLRRTNIFYQAAMEMRELGRKEIFEFYNTQGSKNTNKKSNNIEKNLKSTKSYYEENSDGAVSGANEIRSPRPTSTIKNTAAPLVPGDVAKAAKIAHSVVLDLETSAPEGVDPSHPDYNKLASVIQAAVLFLDDKGNTIDSVNHYYPLPDGHQYPAKFKDTDKDGNSTFNLLEQNHRTAIKSTPEQTAEALEQALKNTSSGSIFAGHNHGADGFDLGMLEGGLKGSIAKAIFEALNPFMQSHKSHDTMQMPMALFARQAEIENKPADQTDLFKAFAKAAQEQDPTLEKSPSSGFTLEAIVKALSLEVEEFSSNIDTAGANLTGFHDAFSDATLTGIVHNVLLKKLNQQTVKKLSLQNQAFAKKPIVGEDLNKPKSDASSATASVPNKNILSLGDVLQVEIVKAIPLIVTTKGSLPSRDIKDHPAVSTMASAETDYNAVMPAKVNPLAPPIPVAIKKVPPAQSKGTTASQLGSVNMDADIGLPDNFFSKGMSGVKRKEGPKENKILDADMQDLFKSFSVLAHPILSKAKVFTGTLPPEKNKAIGVETHEVFDSLPDNAKTLIQGFQRAFNIDISELIDFSSFKVFEDKKDNLGVAGRHIRNGEDSDKLNSISLTQKPSDAGDSEGSAFNTFLHESIHAMFSRLRGSLGLEGLGKVESIDTSVLEGLPKSVAEQYNKFAQQTKKAFIKTIAIQDYGNDSPDSIAKATEDLKSMPYFAKPEEQYATLTGLSQANVLTQGGNLSSRQNLITANSNFNNKGNLTSDQSAEEVSGPESVVQSRRGFIGSVLSGVLAASLSGAPPVQAGEKKSLDVKKQEYDRDKANGFDSAVPYWGKLIEVLDGDTIKALVDGVKVSIRTEYNDAPESDQPFGKESKEHLQKLIGPPGSEFYATPKPGKDRGREPAYNRPLARINNTKGQDVATEMVRAGMSMPAFDDSSPMSDNIRKLGAQAGESEIGVHQFTHRGSPNILPSKWRGFSPEQKAWHWKQRKIAETKKDPRDVSPQEPPPQSTNLTPMAIGLGLAGVAGAGLAITRARNDHLAKERYRKRHEEEDASPSEIPGSESRTSATPEVPNLGLDRGLAMMKKYAKGKLVSPLKDRGPSLLGNFIRAIVKKAKLPLILGTVALLAGSMITQASHAAEVEPPSNKATSSLVSELGDKLTPEPTPELDSTEPPSPSPTPTPEEEAPKKQIEHRLSFGERENLHKENIKKAHKAWFDKFEHPNSSEGLSSPEYEKYRTLDSVIIQEYPTLGVSGNPTNDPSLAESGKDTSDETAAKQAVKIKQQQDYETRLFEHSQKVSAAWKESKISEQLNAADVSSSVLKENPLIKSAKESVKTAENNFNAKNPEMVKALDAWKNLPEETNKDSKDATWQIYYDKYLNALDTTPEGAKVKETKNTLFDLTDFTSLHKTTHPELLKTPEGIAHNKAIEALEDNSSKASQDWSRLRDKAVPYKAENQTPISGPVGDTSFGSFGDTPEIEDAKDAIAKAEEALEKSYQDKRDRTGATATNKKIDTAKDAWHDIPEVKALQEKQSVFKDSYFKAHPGVTEFYDKDVTGTKEGQEYVKNKAAEEALWQAYHKKNIQPLKDEKMKAWEADKGPAADAHNQKEIELEAQKEILKVLQTPDPEPIAPVEKPPTVPTPVPEVKAPVPKVEVKAPEAPAPEVKAPEVKAPAPKPPAPKAEAPKAEVKPQEPAEESSNWMLGLLASGGALAAGGIFGAKKLLGGKKKEKAPKVKGKFDDWNDSPLQRGNFLPLLKDLEEEFKDDDRYKLNIAPHDPTIAPETAIHNFIQDNEDLLGHVFSTYKRGALGKSNLMGPNAEAGFNFGGTKSYGDIFDLDNKKTDSKALKAIAVEWDRTRQDNGVYELHRTLGLSMQRRQDIEASKGPGNRKDEDGQIVRNEPTVHIMKEIQKGYFNAELESQYLRRDAFPSTNMAIVQTAGFRNEEIMAIPADVVEAVTGLQPPAIPEKPLTPIAEVEAPKPAPKKQAGFLEKVLSLNLFGKKKKPPLAKPKPQAKQIIEDTPEEVLSDFNDIDIPEEGPSLIPKQDSVSTPPNSHETAPLALDNLTPLQIKNNKLREAQRLKSLEIAKQKSLEAAYVEYVDEIHGTGQPEALNLDASLNTTPISSISSEPVVAPVAAPLAAPVVAHEISLSIPVPTFGGESAATAEGSNSLFQSIGKDRDTSSEPPTYAEVIKSYGFQTIKDHLSEIKPEDGEYTSEQEEQRTALNTEINRRNNFKPGIPGTISKNVNNEQVYTAEDGENYPYSETEGIDTRFGRSGDVDPDISTTPKTPPVDKNPYKDKPAPVTQPTIDPIAIAKDKLDTAQKQYDTQLAKDNAAQTALPDDQLHLDNGELHAAANVLRTAKSEYDVLVPPPKPNPPKHTSKSFAKDISEGAKKNTPEDVEFYNNNKDEIEKELQQLKDATSTPTPTTTQIPLVVTPVVSTAGTTAEAAAKKIEDQNKLDKANKEKAAKDAKVKNSPLGKKTSEFVKKLEAKNEKLNADLVTAQQTSEAINNQDPGDYEDLENQKAEKYKQSKANETSLQGKIEKNTDTIDLIKKISIANIELKKISIQEPDKLRTRRLERASYINQLAKLGSIDLATKEKLLDSHKEEYDAVEEKFSKTAVVDTKPKSEQKDIEKTAKENKEGTKFQEADNSITLLEALGETVNRLTGTAYGDVQKGLDGKDKKPIDYTKSFKSMSSLFYGSQEKDTEGNEVKSFDYKGTTVDSKGNKTEQEGKVKAGSAEEALAMLNDECGMFVNSLVTAETGLFGWSARLFKAEGHRNEMETDDGKGGTLTNNATAHALDFNQQQFDDSDKNDHSAPYLAKIIEILQAIMAKNATVEVSPVITVESAAQPTAQPSATDTNSQPEVEPTAANPKKKKKKTPPVAKAKTAPVVRPKREVTLEEDNAEIELSLANMDDGEPTTGFKIDTSKMSGDTSAADEHNKAIEQELDDRVTRVAKAKQALLKAIMQGTDLEVERVKLLEDAAKAEAAAFPNDPIKQKKSEDATKLVSDWEQYADEDTKAYQAVDLDDNFIPKKSDVEKDAPIVQGHGDPIVKGPTPSIDEAEKAFLDAGSLDATKDSEPEALSGTPISEENTESTKPPKSKRQKLEDDLTNTRAEYDRVLALKDTPETAFDNKEALGSAKKAYLRAITRLEEEPEDASQAVKDPVVKEDVVPEPSPKINAESIATGTPEKVSEDKELDVYELGKKHEAAQKQFDNFLNLINQYEKNPNSIDEGLEHPDPLGDRLPELADRVVSAFDALLVGHAKSKEKHKNMPSIDWEQFDKESAEFSLPDSSSESSPIVSESPATETAPQVELATKSTNTETPQTTLKTDSVPVAIKETVTPPSNPTAGMDTGSVSKDDTSKNKHESLVKEYEKADLELRKFIDANKDKPGFNDTDSDLDREKKRLKANVEAASAKFNAPSTPKSFATGKNPVQRQGTDNVRGRFKSRSGKIGTEDILVGENESIVTAAASAANPALIAEMNRTGKPIKSFKKGYTPAKAESGFLTGLSNFFSKGKSEATEGKKPTTFGGKQSSGDILAPLKVFGEQLQNTRIGFFAKSLMGLGGAATHAMNSLASFTKSAGGDTFNTLTGSIDLLIGAIGIQLTPLILRISMYIQNMAAEIQEGTGFFGGMVKGITGFINSISNADLKFLISLGAIAAGVSALLPLFGILTGALGILATGVSMVFGMFASPVLLVVGAIAGLIIAVGGFQGIINTVCMILNNYKSILATVAIGFGILAGVWLVANAPIIALAIAVGLCVAAVMKAASWFSNMRKTPEQKKEEAEEAKKNPGIAEKLKDFKMPDMSALTSMFEKIPGGKDMMANLGIKPDANLPPKKYKDMNKKEQEAQDKIDEVTPVTKKRDLTLEEHRSNDSVEAQKQELKEKKDSARAKSTLTRTGVANETEENQIKSYDTQIAKLDTMVIKPEVTVSNVKADRDAHNATPLGKLEAQKDALEAKKKAFGGDPMGGPLAMSMKANRAQPAFSSVEEASKKIQISALGVDPLEAKKEQQNQLNLQEQLKAYSELNSSILAVDKSIQAQQSK